MTKHTQGEWKFNEGNMTGAVFCGDDFIASVYPNAPDGWDGISEYPEADEMRANARLVAAAPNMLAALERQIANIERWIETGVPADEEESKSIYNQMKSSVVAAKEGKK